MKLVKKVLVASTLLCILTGCSARQEVVVHPASNPEPALSQPANRDLVVLLSDRDGKVGAVQVTTPGGSQTIERSGYGTEVEYLSKPPTVPKPLSEDEITRVFGPALSAQPDLTGRFSSFILYFESNTTKLTNESQELIRELVSTISNRRTKEIYVVGHTDRVGTEVYNRELSSRRATYVQDLLVSSGILLSGLVVSYQGETMPAVHTEDEVAEPGNRRVEVFIR